MTKYYECILVLDPALTDEQKSEIINKVKDTLLANQGEVEKVEDWGRRELAYKIKGRSQGLYIWFIMKGNPSFIPVLESSYRVDDKVLRHLIITRQKVSPVKPAPKAGAPEGEQAGAVPAEEAPAQEGQGTITESEPQNQ